MNEWTPRLRDLLVTIVGELHESYALVEGERPWPWTMAIYEEARKRWLPPPPAREALSYGTVYNNLQALEKKGRIERIVQTSHGSKDLRWRVVLEPPMDDTIEATLAWLDS